MITIEINFENLIDGFCFFKAFMEKEDTEIDDFWVDDKDSIRIVITRHYEEINDGN